MINETIDKDLALDLARKVNDATNNKWYVFSVMKSIRTNQDIMDLLRLFEEMPNASIGQIEMRLQDIVGK